jgi:hypothetical protein
MIQWLIRKFNARRRNLDLEILWPACRDNAPNIKRAKEVFYMHAMMDEAWLELGRDEIIRAIERLK